MSYAPTPIELAISHQICEMIIQYYGTPGDAATEVFNIEPDEVRKKMRNDRPWSRKDMLNIAQATGATWQLECDTCEAGEMLAQL